MTFREILSRCFICFIELRCEFIVINIKFLLLDKFTERLVKIKKNFLLGNLLSSLNGLKKN